jgi:hypothetical protein
MGWYDFFENILVVLNKIRIFFIRVFWYILVFAFVGYAVITLFGICYFTWKFLIFIGVL